MKDQFKDTEKKTQYLSGYDRLKHLTTRDITENNKICLVRRSCSYNDVMKVTTVILSFDPVTRKSDRHLSPYYSWKELGILDNIT
jgi:hypothetical protein